MCKPSSETKPVFCPCRRVESGREPPAGPSPFAARLNRTGSRYPATADTVTRLARQKGRGGDCRLPFDVGPLRLRQDRGALSGLCAPNVETLEAQGKTVVIVTAR